MHVHKIDLYSQDHTQNVKIPYLIGSAASWLPLEETHGRKISDADRA